MKHLLRSGTRLDGVFVLPPVARPSALANMATIGQTTATRAWVIQDMPERCLVGQADGDPPDAARGNRTLQVNELVRLLESGDYRRCLEQALPLLTGGSLEAAARARVLQVICRSRLGLTDYFGAVEAGEQAVALAAEVGESDLLGFALIDLAAALAKIRRRAEALAAYERFLSQLHSFVAARCMEGTVLHEMALVLQQLGQPKAALRRLAEAISWFIRYGDEESAHACRRSAAAVHMEQGHLDAARILLEQCDHYVQNHSANRELFVNHLLDWAALHFAAGRHQESAQVAFQALEHSVDNLEQQARAQLLLSSNALAMGQPKDALNFAMGARVSAIDGRFYQMEFEAADVIFRVLRSEGVDLLRELDAEYYQEGVDLYHYLSARVIDRMTREQ